MSLGLRIKELRKHLGISQSDFANGIGKTSGFISLLETGRSDMSQETVRAIINEYGVNEEWLLKGTGEMFAEGRNVAQAEWKHIGERIKRIRENAGLSQADFAKRINKSKNQVYMVESGRSNPSEEFIKNTTKEFAVNYNWLKSGEGDIGVQKKQPDDLKSIMELMEKDSVAREVVLEIMKHDRSIWLKIDRMVREEG